MQNLQEPSNKTSIEKEHSVESLVIQDFKISHKSISIDSFLSLQQNSRNMKT